ncbi:MAG: hypothetical protein R2828_20695 [Saprospiraceae bacterium]
MCRTNLVLNNCPNPVFALFVLLVLTLGCDTLVPIDDIERAPKVTPADEPLANVYARLDGHWKGQFFTFKTMNIGERDDEVLYNLTRENIQQEALNLSSTLVVEQFYTSESPYFQQVKIIDFYPETGETVTSLGVNKVQDGQMWCVVRKPNETVIHQGTHKGENTIVWQRQEQQPQRIEYFHETVLPNTYEIIGWGYYDGDDITKMPKTWFYAQYQRSNE